jgi:hypothetical protein
VKVVAAVVPSKVAPEYTWYDVAPGLAVHDNSTWALAGVAVTFAGALGAGGCGVAVAGAEAGDDPPALVATTVNEYSVPFVRPAAVYDVEDVVVNSVEPAYTLYEVADATEPHDNVTCALPGVATRFAGAIGGSGIGVTETDVEGADVPPALLATTVMA